MEPKIKAKINKKLLLQKPYDKGFVWLCRYSDNESFDDMGRWARICYYNGFMIAWITGFEKSKGKLQLNPKKKCPNVFNVHLLFPCSSNQGGYGEIFNNLEDAKKYAVGVFKDLKKLINQ